MCAKRWARGLRPEARVERQERAPTRISKEKHLERLQELGGGNDVTDGEWKQECQMLQDLGKAVVGEPTGFGS